MRGTTPITAKTLQRLEDEIYWCEIFPTEPGSYEQHIDPDNLHHNYFVPPIDRWLDGIPPNVDEFGRRIVSLNERMRIMEVRRRVAEMRVKREKRQESKPEPEPEPEPETETRPPVLTYAQVARNAMNTTPSAPRQTGSAPPRQLSPELIRAHCRLHEARIAMSTTPRAPRPMASRPPSRSPEMTQARRRLREARVRGETMRRLAEERWN